MANPKDALRDIRNLLSANVYKWKFKALDDSINKLKLHFPITDEMLEDIKHLTRERYTSANKAFRMAELKHYDNAHRWIPLMQKMAQEEALVHAIWDYVQDLANTRQHTPFRKSLMDICMEVGVKDFERLGDSRPNAVRTSAQRKMIVQSLVMQKRYTRTEPLTAGVSLATNSHKPSRATAFGELKTKCEEMNKELKEKDKTIASLKGVSDNLRIERNASGMSKGEFELDEDVASLSDSNESSLTPDSGFKSGNRRKNGSALHTHHENSDSEDEVNNLYQPRGLHPRPVSVRGMRPKSAFGSNNQDGRHSASHRCHDCEVHVREIERQRSNISILTQTLDEHEKAFSSIKTSVNQLLNPRKDLGSTDTTNPRILLQDIDSTIKKLKSDINKTYTNPSGTSRREVDEERIRLQEMVDTLLADKLRLESQKTILESNWQESKALHRKDIEKHHKDIEDMKQDVHSMTENHKDEIKQLVDEHKKEMNENREQFNNMVAVVMTKLNSTGPQGAPNEHNSFEPWANVSRGSSRMQSRNMSRTTSRSIAEERLPEQDDCEDEASVTWSSRNQSRNSRRHISRQISPDPEGRRTPNPGTLGHHSEDSLVLISSRRRKKGPKTPIPETMRVSPEMEERDPLPILRPGSQFGNYNDDDNRHLLSHRERDSNITTPRNSLDRENSFTTISDITRRNQRKTMR